MSLTPRQSNILDALKKANKELSTKEVAQLTGHNQVGIAHDLKGLTSQGYVSRSYAKGNSYIYKYQRSIPTPPVGSVIPADMIYITEMHKMAHSISWMPSFIKDRKYVALPEAMIQLLKLAVDQRDGEKISQHELDILRTNLAELARKAKGLADGCDRLLANKELWQVETFAKYIDIETIGSQ
jgi:hypothetical protein